MHPWIFLPSKLTFAFMGTIAKWFYLDREVSKEEIILFKDDFCKRILLKMPTYIRIVWYWTRATAWVSFIKN